MSARSKVDHREEAELAVQKITTAVEAITSGDEWQEWLAFLAKLHNYSPLNRLLMWAQWETRRHLDPSLPMLTLPSARTKWNALGRYVKKGEKALELFAPRLVKKIDEETGKERKVLVGYRIVRGTFDVSQTHGDDLPENPVKTSLLEGDGDEALWERLVVVAGLVGYTVRRGIPCMEEANGHCDYSLKEIVIHRDRPGAQQGKTLIHEIAHAMMHEPDDYLMAHRIERSVCEVEAESTAFTVSAMLGMDTSSYSFGYVANWSGGKAIKVAESATRIIDCAERIVNAIETGEMPKTQIGKGPKLLQEEAVAA